MQNAATVVVYEGAPNHPDNGRFWEIVQKCKVSIFYTAPTAIRAFMKWGDEWHNKCDLSSLRLLGTVGEAINPEAWIWYHEVIGGKRCPIVDTYWQTETGGIILSPLPGVTPTKPGSATLPMFGIDPAILTEEGEVRAGILSVRKPWLRITRGIWATPSVSRIPTGANGTVNSTSPAMVLTKDEDGYIWILGRVDDVVNVSGHREEAAELESIYVEHPAVAESAVIGVAHEIKGQGLVSFVTLRQGFDGSDDLRKELNGLVAQKIGKFAFPKSASSSPRTFPRLVPARSCAGSSETLPKAASWAMSLPWPTRPSLKNCKTSSKTGNLERPNICEHGSPGLPHPSRQGNL